MVDLKAYKARLEQMEGFELRAEEESLRRTYGGKKWSSEQYAEIKELCEVFLSVQNKRREAIYKRNKQKGFRPRGFIGFLR